MGNCIRKKRHTIEFTDDPRNVYLEELNAYISLELEDISESFKFTFGEELIKKKAYQQYHWYLEKNQNYPDKYITLKDWKLRYVWNSTIID